MLAFGRFGVALADLQVVIVGQFFAGVNVAPAASRIVSPATAVSSACCSSRPFDTLTRRPMLIGEAVQIVVIW